MSLCCGRYGRQVQQRCRLTFFNEPTCRRRMD
jgi:hypothetical protein